MSNATNPVTESSPAWDVCSHYPPSDWRDEVDSEDTQLGYRQWVVQKLQKNHATDDGSDIDHFWDVCSMYPPEDWRQEAAAGDTQLGYRDWVEHCLERDQEDNSIEPPEWSSQLPAQNYQRMVTSITTNLREQYDKCNRQRANPEDHGVLTRRDLEQNMAELAFFHNRVLDYLGATHIVRLKEDISEVYIPCPGPDICNGDCDDLSCDADK